MTLCLGSSPGGKFQQLVLGAPLDDQLGLLGSKVPPGSKVGHYVWKVSLVADFSNLFWEGPWWVILATWPRSASWWQIWASCCEHPFGNFALERPLVANSGILFGESSVVADFGSAPALMANFGKLPGGS